MGRIGQSLIMLGQPPYCSLFSVCRADDGLRVCWYGCYCVCVRACVCVCVYISMHCVRWDKGAAGKKDPSLSHPPPPRLTSMPLQIGFYITEAVRYEQLIFLSLFLLFLSFIPLSYFLASFFLSISFFLSWYFNLSPFPFFLLLFFFLPSFLPSTSSSSRYCEHCFFEW